MRSTSRSARAASRTLPEATQWSGVGPAGPVADGDEVRAVDLGDGEHRVALEDRRGRSSRGSAGRAARAPGSAMPRRSSVRSARSARRMTTSPSRYLPVSSSCSTRPALLERREEPRRGRLVQPEAAGQLGDAGLALAVAEGEQERRGPVDRADRVAVKDHRSLRSSSAGAGRCHAAVRRRRRARGGRGPRGPRRASRRRRSGRGR